MAKYKTLDNGKYGYNYRGYQIIKDDPSLRRSTYSVLKEDNSVLFEALSDYHEAEWRIDITVADDAEIEKIKELAQMEIFELNGKALEMAHEYEGKRLTKEKKRALDLVLKVRDRKSEQKPLFY